MARGTDVRQIVWMAHIKGKGVGCSKHDRVSRVAKVRRERWEEEGKGDNMIEVRCDASPTDNVVRRRGRGGAG